MDIKKAAEVLAKIAIEKSSDAATDAVRAELEKMPKDSPMLMDSTELLGARGKRVLEMALMGGGVGGVLGGASSLLLGNKPKKALKHALMGSGIGALVGGGGTQVLSSMPLFGSTFYPGDLSTALWGKGKEESSLYFTPDGSIVSGPPKPYETGAWRVFGEHARNK